LSTLLTISFKIVSEIGVIVVFLLQWQKNLYPAFFHDSLLMLANVINSSLSKTQSNSGKNNHANHSTKLDVETGSSLLQQYIANKNFEGKLINMDVTLL